MALRPIPTAVPLALPEAPGWDRPRLSTIWKTPWGLTLIGNYAMVKSRHMFQYGTTHAQFAHISVATRRHAMRNPEAVQAMTDLEFVGVPRSPSTMFLSRA